NAISRVDENCLSGMWKDQEIGPGITRVVEATLAESLHQQPSLHGSGEVCFPVARDYFIENPQMTCHLSRVFLVRCCREYEPPPFSELIPQILQECSVVRKGTDVQLDHLRDLVFEPSLAAHEPIWSQQCKPRAAVK